MKKEIEFIDYERKKAKQINRDKFNQDHYFKMLSIHLAGMIQGISIICLIVLYELDYIYLAMILLLVVYGLIPPVRLYKRK